jgi:UDP-glucose 4-epimerase
MMALQGYIDDFAVFGADFPTPDGTAIRDYIHVADLAQAHVLALKRMLDGAKGGAAFNLGAGRGYSVSEVLAMIGEVSGREMAAPKGARRPGDPASLVADARLARRELGFDPSHSDLRTIVETAWRWHLAAHPRRNAAAVADHRETMQDSERSPLRGHAAERIVDEHFKRIP